MCLKIIAQIRLWLCHPIHVFVQHAKGLSHFVSFFHRILEQSNMQLRDVCESVQCKPSVMLQHYKEPNEFPFIFLLFVLFLSLDFCGKRDACSRENTILCISCSKIFMGNAENTIYEDITEKWYQNIYIIIFMW